MVWSADFLPDALACGRRIRTFNVFEDFNLEALHIEVDTSINSARLVRIFEQLKRDHGLPQVLRTERSRVPGETREEVLDQHLFARLDDVREVAY